mmetsp:Transcript_22059/g.18909  ORF Transcript_22059/g.18909 Transcript_22059/m.18909 type:complete len:126 (+) Transcript_22059:545-922(+)
MFITHFNKMGKIFIETKAAFLDNMKKNKHQKAESVIQNNANEILQDAREDVGSLQTYFRYKSWDDLPFTAKLKFFNGWFIWNTLGCSFAVISSFIVFITYLIPARSLGLYVGEVPLGLSVFFFWI